MEIVIDIDDNLYTRLFDNGVDNYDDAVDMARAIRKGTPLPKGHGDLIDRNELLDWSYEIDSMYCVYDKVVNVDDINDAQTIIEAAKEVQDEDSD